MFLDKKNGMSVPELMVKYDLSESRVKHIVFWQENGLPSPKRGGATTFTTEDFHAVRKLTDTYTVDGVLKELARIAGNYGNTSPRHKRMAEQLRTLVARNSR